MELRKVCTVFLTSWRFNWRLRSHIVFLNSIVDSSISIQLDFSVLSNSCWCSILLWDWIIQFTGLLCLFSNLHNESFADAFNNCDCILVDQKLFSNCQYFQLGIPSSFSMKPNSKFYLRKDLHIGGNQTKLTAPTTHVNTP